MRVVTIKKRNDRRHCKNRSKIKIVNFDVRSWEDP
jgi:hypothetical protein